MKNVFEQIISYISQQEIIHILRQSILLTTVDSPFSYSQFSHILVAYQLVDYYEVLLDLVMHVMYIVTNWKFVHLLTQPNKKRITFACRQCLLHTIIKTFVKNNTYLGSNKKQFGKHRIVPYC